MVYCNHQILEIVSPATEAYSSAAEIRLPQSILQLLKLSHLDFVKVMLLYIIFYCYTEILL